MGKNVVINGVTYIGIEGFSAPADDGSEAAFYEVSGTTVTPETLKKGETARNAAGELITGTMEASSYPEADEPVAQFGSVTYKSVQQALDVAAEAGGGTVTMIANATEDDIIVPAGVTLDLKTKVLTVNGNMVVYGNMLGQTVNATRTGGRIVIGAEMLSIFGELYPYNNTYYVPVWDSVAKNYMFSVFGLSETSLEVTEGQVIYKFYHSSTSYGNSGILGNGGSDNLLTVVVRSSWDTEIGRVHQDYEYNDEFVAAVSAGGSVYTFNMTDIEEKADLKIQAMIVTNTGAKVIGTEHAVEYTPPQVAQFGETVYSTVQKALDAAEAAGGGTVTLIADTTEADDITVPAGVVFDLNGKTLTAAKTVLVYGAIDDDTFGDAKLVMPQGNLVMNATFDVNNTEMAAETERGKLPVYDTDGYRFWKFKIASGVGANGTGSAKILMQFSILNKSGAADKAKMSALSGRFAETGLVFQFEQGWVYNTYSQNKVFAVSNDLVETQISKGGYITMYPGEIAAGVNYSFIPFMMASAQIMTVKQTGAVKTYTGT